MNTGRAAWVAGAVLVVASGCEAAPVGGPTPSAPPSAPPATAGCVRPSGGAPVAGSEMVPTASNGLPRSTVAGQPLVIDAVVLQRDCRPAAGAEVHAWHTDAQGLYGPGPTECCYYDGTVRTDQQGRFRIRTIRPGAYPGQGATHAHIHLEIRHSTADLITEILFGSDQPTDRVPPTEGDVSIALREDGAGWRGDVVFVLR